MRYLKNAAQLELDQHKCIGCWMCMEVCPHAVFKAAGKKVEITEKDLCMECGACQQNCPSGALKVRAGVGCANAVIRGKIRGTEPDCGCEDSQSCC